MGTEQSASMMRIAVLAVIVAVAMSSMEQEVEVSELADAGHTAKAQLGEAITPAQLNTVAANNNNPDMAGTGRFKGTKTLNFPGTPYGKPGYKESHNWEQDTDWFSPLVFKWKYYAAQYGLKGKSEEAVKKDWMTNVINKKDTKYPDCRVGSPTFSPQTYYRANGDMPQETGGLCYKIMRNFITSGLFNGAKLIDANKEKEYIKTLTLEKLKAFKGNTQMVTFRSPGGCWPHHAWGRRRSPNNRRRRWWRRHAGHSSWILRKWRHMDLMSFQITEIYTLTFWFKQYAYNHWGHPRNWGRPWHGYKGESGLWWNILHMGATHSERQPAIWLSNDRNGPRMVTRVSLENNEYGLPCDPPSTWSNANGKLGQRNSHWTMVAMVVNTHGTGNHAMTTMYFDGKKVHECKATSRSRSGIPAYQERKPNGQEQLGGRDNKFRWWMDWSGGHKYFWVSSPWYRQARIRIGHMHHYPDSVMPDAVIEAEHEIERTKVQNTRVYYEWSHRRRRL